MPPNDFSDARDIAPKIGQWTGLGPGLHRICGIRITLLRALCNTKQDGRHTEQIEGKVEAPVSRRNRSAPDEVLPLIISFFRYAQALQIKACNSTL